MVSGFDWLLCLRLFNEHYLKLGRYTTQSDYNALRNNLIRELKCCAHFFEEDRLAANFLISLTVPVCLLL